MFHNYKERKLIEYTSGKAFITFVDAGEEIIRHYGCDETIYTRRVRINDRVC